MSKMTKKEIPSTHSLWDKLDNNERRKAVLEFFRTHLKGKKVLNEDTGLSIEFTIKSGRKTAYGEAMYPKKAEMVRLVFFVIGFDN